MEERKNIKENINVYKASNNNCRIRNHIDVGTTCAFIYFSQYLFLIFQLLIQHNDNGCDSVTVTTKSYTTTESEAEKKLVVIWEIRFFLIWLWLFFLSFSNRIIPHFSL